jgi:hypothetical protein
MNGLPKTIIALDAKRAETGRYTRLEPGTGVLKTLAERDYDELIVRHVDVLAEVLRDAELIDTDSKLKNLGRQVARIDVLFAEVDADDAFRRLVIVEDKLLRNPGARRTVLAQIFEYTDTLQQLTMDQLREKLSADNSEWFDENSDEIARTLRAGDFLLVICGDQIHQRVAWLAERFAKEANPLSQLDLCLVAFAFYEGPAEALLLVPALLGTVVKAQRELTIRVSVADRRGDDVPFAATLESGQVKAAGNEAQFFGKQWAKFTPQDIAAGKAVIAALEHSAIPGLTKKLMDSGRAIFGLDGTRFGSIKVLQLASSQAALRDTPEKNRVVMRDAAGAQAWREYQEALRKVPGANEGGKLQGRVYVPVKQAEGRIQLILDAIRRLAQALG